MDDGEVQIAFLLFPRVTALDAIGPYEVLQRLPGAEVVFVGAERGEVRTDNGYLGLTVDATIDEVAHPEVLVVPGGMSDFIVCSNRQIRRGRAPVGPLGSAGQEARRSRVHR